MYESPRKIFVGVENGHDEVNIQISVKINMNVFMKSIIRKDYFY